MIINISIDIPEDRINELSNSSYVNASSDNVKVALEYAINKLIDEMESNIIDESIYGRLASYFSSKLDKLDYEGEANNVE